MDIFDEEILEFWKALEKNKIQYILIGGYAMNFHGYHRFNEYMEMWLNDTLPNRQALRKTFIECAIGDYAIIGQMQFVPRWTEFRLNNKLQLDILTDMKGLEKYSLMNV